MANCNTVNDFTWGKAKGTSNKDKKYYSSFFLEKEEYHLFDNVIVHDEEDSDGHVAKIMKLWQDISSGTMMTLLRWFLKPHELPSHLQGQMMRENSKELFLAFGKGKGVSNENKLDCIERKCKVLCTSKDGRNIQPSEHDLKDAEYFFDKIYNVDLKKLTNLMGIVRILGEDVLFNKPEWVSTERFSDRDAGFASVNLLPSATMHEAPAVQQPMDDGQVLVPGSETRSGDPRANHGPSTPLKGGSKADNSLPKGSIATSDRDKPVADRAKFRASVKQNTLHTLSGTQRAYQDALERSSPTAQQPLTRSASAKKAEVDLSKEKVEAKLTTEIPITGRALFADPLLQPALSIPTRARSKQVQHQDSTLPSKPLGVNLEESLCHGRVLLIQNVDPLFTSKDVYDLIKVEFKGCSDAQMLQQSSAQAGEALLVFETDSSADLALQQLEENCIVLPGCRPLIASKVKPFNPGKIARFPGHFPLDNFKLWKQRQEEVMKKSFEISHFPDPNTLESEMATEWQQLHEWLSSCREQLCKMQREEQRVLLEKYKKPKLCLP